MNTLEKIINYKKEEVEKRKKLYPVELLKQQTYFEATPVSLKKYLLDPNKTGIIAEFKRQSPSEGIINQHAKVEETSIGYMQAGSSALSILTDKPSFGGDLEDLKTARKFNFCPILRKDFMIDSYQVYEAKANGADAILLIAAAIDRAKAEELAALAHELKMEVLLEVHNEEEINSHLGDYVDLVGVNSRDLKSFKTDLEGLKALYSKIPDEYVKIAESGIKTSEDYLKLKTLGFKGFLIGTTFMKNTNPAKACQKFSQQIRITKN
ncbi:indole-3-glycerol phosphate synthase TrpC [Marivirga atlantica]|uniref:indole-3-glycerol-phosphate synthase n=1 Tax=Marivirga atlantica TaxID=1548457 RepID=A0A937A7I9_9BACT|nr:indole-3-glycerol phosphate synthase TrpC [Marivirga atlantica]MBL0765055.1 indole-3-glycerol phosphate synthase TrpC [Marivirga atlantica]